MLTLTSQKDASVQNYSTWSVLQLIFKKILGFLARVLMKIDIEGIENIPADGSLIVAVNHLHLFDAALIFIIMTRPITFFAKRRMRKPPFNWLLACMGHVIYINVGKIDRRAFLNAKTVLKHGGVLGIAPEGFISSTGGLIKGQRGIAYLATQTHALILPIAMYGQEKMLNDWKRFRQGSVYINIGQVVELSAGIANKEQLEAYTEHTMLELARLLPQKYRGVYTGFIKSNDENGITD